MALRDLVTKHNIRFKKTLGQNLLLDENINRIMVDAAALGEKIRASVEEAPFIIRRQRIGMTVSIGVSNLRLTIYN